MRSFYFKLAHVFFKCYKFSMRVRSGNWEGHSNNLMLFSENNMKTSTIYDLGRCLLEINNPERCFHFILL